MFRRLFSLFAAKPEPVDELTIARQARRRAAEAYASAVQRGDTRDQHAAHRRFKSATNALLRLERGVGA